MAKTEMEDKYTPNQLKQIAVVKGNKFYAKSRFTFHRKKVTMYPSNPFILPKDSKLNKAILTDIYDRQDRFTVENNLANVHAQTKFGKLLGANHDIQEIRIHCIK